MVYEINQHNVLLSQLCQVMLKHLPSIKVRYHSEQLIAFQLNLPVMCPSAGCSVMNPVVKQIIGSRWIKLHLANRQVSVLALLLIEL